MVMDEEKKTSKFSSGLNIITRLDILWRKCHDLKRTGRFNDWNNELDTIWLELARDLSQEDYNDKINEKKEIISEGYATQFSKYDIKLKELLPFIDGGVGFKKPEQDAMKKRNEQYKVLMDKQLFLARLENELDKGTTYEEEDEDF